MPPPNDTLFETPAAEDAAAATDPTGAATGNATTAVAPPPTPSLTIDQVEQRIHAAVSPLQRENDALKLAIAQSNQPAPAAPPTGDDFVASFNRDPAAAIKAVADQSSSDGLRQLAPHLNTLINSANEAFLGAQETRIVAEFGQDAWDKVFHPQLVETFTQLRRENPFAVADIHRVQREVNTITGGHFAKLIEMRDAHQKGRTTASEAERASIIEAARKGITTNLTGGIRVNPKGSLPEPEPEMKAAIADMDRVTGRKTNMTEWVKEAVAVQNSANIDEWLANTKPAGRA